MRTTRAASALETQHVHGEGLERATGRRRVRADLNATGEQGSANRLIVPRLSYPPTSGPNRRNPSPHDSRTHLRAGTASRARLARRAPRRARAGAGRSGTGARPTWLRLATDR